MHEMVALGEDFLKSAPGVISGALKSFCKGNGNVCGPVGMGSRCRSAAAAATARAELIAVVAA